MSHSPDFTDWTLLSQGAEARVWRRQDTICKERFPKQYRHPDMDKRLTKSRGRAEARLLQKCRTYQIPVPNIQSGDCNENCIYMEYIDGVPVRQHLLSVTIGEERELLARKIGSLIAQLHNAGIIHGDLTTSNMMLRNGTVYLIDFGLATSSNSSEERAVDLYVFERALSSTHPELPESFMLILCQAYQDVIEKPRKLNQPSVLQRLEQVRQRGRKRECFG